MPISRARFAAPNGVRVLLISLFLLAPCLWHPRIEAGDLPSHTYNAWLAHLIKTGQAPSLYFEPAWNNILVDVGLEKIGDLAGYPAAERIVSGTCVLIFFWGAFLFIGAVNVRPPWPLAPAIAIVTYGWTFYSGFFNFYLGLGLAFFAMAFLLRGRAKDLLIAAILAVLVLVAHPFAFLCLLGLAIYFGMAGALHGWQRWCLPALALLGIVVAHEYLGQMQTFFRHVTDFYQMNGTDQMVLFERRYLYLAWFTMAFVALSVLAAVPDIRRSDKPWTGRSDSRPTIPNSSVSWFPG
jgi:hypothetical protein